MSAIRLYLNQIDQMHRLGGKVRSLASVMLDHGRAYRVGPETYAGPRGVPRQCYMNAGRIALEEPSLTYVEGFVTLPRLGHLAIEHGFLATRDGVVIDPTLPDDEGEREYLGLPIKTEVLREHLLETGVWGVLGMPGPIMDAVIADRLADILEVAT